MSRKSKGINAERELIHLFWAAGWAGIRVAGSGSIKYPCPDILAGKNSRVIAIEVKATKDDKKYLLAEEIRQLKQFCEIFNAEPWIGVKFSRENWLFLTLDQLDEKEKSHSISLKDAKKRGFLFEELIKE